ncbi:MAG: hypothetical protein LH478_09235 [Chitinophagaceae bacterium]|nr:hypothetical protein [Chitinophagaceae bacterium]
MRSRMYVVILMGTMFLVSCKRDQATKGIIFERKHLGNNKLQIKYRYTIDYARYTDSVTIDNQVLKNDSLTVRFDPENPTKTFVDLKK